MPTTTVKKPEEGGAPALSLALSPQGHVHVDLPAGADVAPPLAQLAKPFELGDGNGVFRLGAAEPETPPRWRAGLLA